MRFDSDPAAFVPLIILLIFLALLGYAVSWAVGRVLVDRKRIRNAALALGLIGGAVCFLSLDAWQVSNHVSKAIGVAVGVVFATGIASYLLLIVLAFIFEHLLASPEWRAEARERRALRRAAKERRRENRRAARWAKASARGQRRREAARARCDTRFALVAADIRERFSKEAFEDFKGRHLSDDKSPEYVEERARELCNILKRHLEEIKGSAEDLREVADARAEVEGYYSQHATLLREIYPRVRLNAELRARIPNTATPEVAWKQAHELLVHLQAIVMPAQRERHERQAHREELEQQLAQIDEQLAALAESSLDSLLGRRRLDSLKRRKQELVSQLQQLS